MGTTFVEINRKGFWLKDGLLELWLRFVSLHIEDSPDEHSEEHQIRDQWLLASRGIFTGCVPIGLGEAVSTETGRNIVINAIDSLLALLKDSPDELNKDVLNLLGMSGKYMNDIKTYRLIEVSEAILDLIDGKIGSDSSDTSFMPGCR